MVFSFSDTLAIPFFGVKTKACELELKVSPLGKKVVSMMNAE